MARLALKQGEVRLLRIARTAENSEVVEITSKIFALTGLDTPKYSALSYVWGDLGSSHSVVLVNRQPFTIYANLHDFFLEERKSFPEGYDMTWWWIDQISINQNDNQERSHQVRQMDRIYEEANLVIAWLGRSVFYNQAQAIDCVWAEDIASWINKEGILNRDYWRRVWTVQEMALARRLSFQVG